MNQYECIVRMINLLMHFMYLLMPACSSRYRGCACRGIALLQASYGLESFSRRRALAVLSNATTPLVDDVLLVEQSFWDFFLKDDEPKASAFFGDGISDHTTVSNFPEAREVRTEIFSSGHGVQTANEDFAAEILARRCRSSSTREQIL